MNFEDWKLFCLWFLFIETELISFSNCHVLQLSISMFYHFANIFHPSNTFKNEVFYSLTSIFMNLSFSNYRIRTTNSHAYKSNWKIVTKKVIKNTFYLKILGGSHNLRAAISGASTVHTRYLHFKIYMFFSLLFQ